MSIEAHSAAQLAPCALTQDEGVSPNINTSGLWLHDRSSDCYPARTRTRRDQQGVQPDERDGIQGHLEGPEDLGAHCQRAVPGRTPASTSALPTAAAKWATVRGAGPLVSCDDADSEYGQDVILEGIARRRVAEQGP